MGTWASHPIAARRANLMPGVLFGFGSAVAMFVAGPRSCWCRVVSCRIVPCRVVSCRVVSCRVVSCRVVSCRVVGGICTGSVTVETVVLLVFITSVTEAEGGVVRPVTSVLQTTQKPELCEFVHESGWGNPDHEVGALHPAWLS